MTEPVAYWHIPQLENEEVFVDFNQSENSNFEDIPLYTAEDLHPRVKMTQKQYKEWQSVIRSIHPVNLYELFNLIFNASEHQGEYAGMRDIFSFDEGQKKLAQLWSDFDPDNPEETIDIIPNMKWFVRSKKRDDEGDFQFISGIETPDDWGYSKNHNGVNDPRACAYAFDTKEEAEKWENPLTEAVLLPLEEN